MCTPIPKHVDALEYNYTGIDELKHLALRVIAINPFQRMDHLYSSEVMECYRRHGEDVHTNVSSSNNTVSRTLVTPVKANP